MLRRIRYGDDAGVATSVLVMGVSVALAAGFLLFGRIAQAGDMRSLAQIGADAAALGSLAPLRDSEVDALIERGTLPSAGGYWMVSTKPEEPASQYAKENKTRLIGKVQLSGLYGTTAKVTVATQECQLKRKEELTAKEREDLRLKRNLCTDGSGKVGIGRSGTATAIAKLIPPQCTWGLIPDTNPDDGMTPFEYVDCGPPGNRFRAYPNGNRERVKRLFKIRLVGQEDSQKYNGEHMGPGADGFGKGNWPVGAECSGSAFTPERITRRMECVRDQIKKLFIVPRGIGCFRTGGSGEHPKGRACDFMISTGAPTPQEAQLGYDISNYAQKNAARLGIYYIIYRQHIWNAFRANEGWRLMEDRGSITQNHFDHPHISVNP
ncbi:hypothetical protein [Spirillospora sp. CA-294931]|uniref:hypothetical protein n=1 Tax=Spirillospora sp. CA-294931 TaxID=3240042 RepID=UPI003D900F98